LKINKYFDVDSNLKHNYSEGVLICRNVNYGFVFWNIVGWWWNKFFI